MIYKRGKVCWYKFKWSVKGGDGTRENFTVRKSARVRSARKAREVEEEHRRALRLGLVHPLDPWPKPPTPEAPRLRGFAERFLEHAALHTKPGTARFYRECLDRILKFSPLADAVMSGVTSELISKYGNWRCSQKVGKAIPTVNAELRTLRRMFRLAEEWGLIPKAPAIHELPGQKGRDRVITHEEEARYLKRTTANLYDLTILAADTGLRPDSELFPLVWKDVCLDNSENIPFGFIHVSTGKTQNAVRNIPLTPRAQAVLLARRATHDHGRYVFPGKGKSGHMVSIQRVHERAIHKAELEPFPFYCWRHTFGTRCAESGMDKFTLARLMGHSSPRVAERYYIHVTEPHVAAGFERFIQYQADKAIESFPAKSERIQ